jgi:predicted 2-oxoglutarate/Fe(II)-dependent dioxygenase YbiX
MENKTLHVDRFREMSMIAAINDDYDGGEICFPDQNFEIKLKKGQVLLFPPYWTHPHRTNKPKNGTFRYTITTWLTVDHGL